MDTDGGGWQLLQKRYNGVQSFSQHFYSYNGGFGNISGEHWLGLYNTKLLLQFQNKTGYHVELRIDLRAADNSTAYAQYNSFSLEDYYYQLAVGDYSGTAGDSLSAHNGYRFSADYRDFDGNYTVECSKVYDGGWWFNPQCIDGYLNGPYTKNGTVGMVWPTWRGQEQLVASEIRLRVTP